MKLILARHGETDSNYQRIIQGCQGDTELNDLGRKQAEALGEALQRFHLSAVYSSHLKRAQQTAELAAWRQGLTVVVEEGLKEIDAGDLDGLTIDQMREDHEAFLMEWRKGSGTLKMPAGESMEEVQARAMPVVERIRATYPDGQVLIVSHVFSLLAILCGTLNFDIGSFRRFRLENAGFSIIEFGPWGNVLTLLNETCHLRDLAKRQ